MTLCDQVERMICAEDYCRVVEGDEEVRIEKFASLIFSLLVSR